MTASAADITRLRRMTNEPNDDTYDDTAMQEYIESWPLVDNNGYTYESSNWSENYDLHAAAADIWEEKAALYSTKHNFSADGASFSSYQLYEAAMSQAKYHRERVKASFKRSVNRTRTATYFPEYRNPIYDEDEDNDTWTDSILG